MIKNFKINSDDIYEILENLADLVKRKQLPKLQYNKWKILNDLAKDEDKLIYFDYEMRQYGSTAESTFWFGDKSIVLFHTVQAEKFVAHELTACMVSTNPAIASYTPSLNKVTESMAQYDNVVEECRKKLAESLSSIKIGEIIYGEVRDSKTNEVLCNIDNASLSIANDEINAKPKTLEEYINDCVEQMKVIDTHKEKNEREENNMFKNFKFGPVENPNVKISPYGIAVQNNSGTYVSYNKDTEEIVDVDILNFKCNNMLYMMPSAIADIKDGDVIIHNRVPMIVVGVDEIDRSRLIAVDVSSGEEKVILPTKSPFGFNFVTKIVSILDMMPTSTEANENNPFGNLLPFMIMGDNKDINPLMFMALSNGSDFTSNPMMLYALAASGKDNDNLLPLMLMGMNMKK